MAAAKAAREAAVFPRVIDVIVGIVAAGLVANPLVIVVDVRRLRMIGLVLEASVVLRVAFDCAIFRCAIVRRMRRGASHGCRAVCGNVTVANIASSATASLSFALSTSGTGQQEYWDAKSEQHREQVDDILHVVCLRKELWHANEQGFLL